MARLKTAQKARRASIHFSSPTNKIAAGNLAIAAGNLAIAAGNLAIAAGNLAIAAGNLAIAAGNLTQLICLEKL